MIIDSGQTIQTSDVTKFSWNGLRRFHNQKYCSDKLAHIHNIDSKHKKNVNKQSQKIRVCLAQAYEYYQASHAVTLATRPTLLYYSIMHLALAEVLMKHTGDGSLDRARQEHRHHGLTANITGKFNPDLSLETSSRRLRAEPTIWTCEERRGTFELWHRTSREMPILGEWESQKVQQHGYRLVMKADDKRLPLVPASGLSLWDCLINLPCMLTHLMTEDILPNYARARCKKIDLDDETKLIVIIHPFPQLILDRLYNQIRIEPNMLEHLTVTERHSGCIITIQSLPDLRSFCSFPIGSTYSPTEVFFSASNVPLNEFGFFYYAFFILGTYARYYPDIWIRDIEENTHLCLAVEALIEGFNQRVPLLALSEMQRNLYVPN